MKILTEKGSPLQELYNHLQALIEETDKTEIALITKSFRHWLSRIIKNTREGGDTKAVKLMFSKK